MSDETDVLHAIDELRRDLSVCYERLKAHGDLQMHCDHQRERIAALERLYARAKAEDAELRELVKAAWRCIHSGVTCSDCRLIAGGCTLQSAMRELGIEVNE